MNPSILKDLRHSFWNPFCFESCNGKVRGEMMNRVLVEHYRCQDEYCRYASAGDLSSHSGYFRFGDDLICFGQCVSGVPASSPVGTLYDAEGLTGTEGGLPRLPLDPEQVIENLRMERYVTHLNGNPFHNATSKLIKGAYYGVRPILPVKIRKHFQKAYLRGRLQRPFPQWPVDSTVEAILEKLLSITMKAKGIYSLPFIWFWPNRASSCAVMTHDVETPSGRDFCVRLMDINDEYGVKASFQIVPERRYRVPEAYLQTMRDRGFEINVQDLNHDGRLYSDKTEFMRRVKLINEYGRQYGARGFRSAVLYRNPTWFHTLKFSYDMSIPNVAHMDPQPGGCCTLFPYSIGKILEIPVTTTQDYTLFHILKQYSLDQWKTQISLIRQRHGLISFIVHPDYVTNGKAQETYKDLLAYLADLRSSENLWIALPREVDQWWRARSQMRLVQQNGGWGIEGPQSERACVAYARLENNRISYTIAHSARN